MTILRNIKQSHLFIVPHADDEVLGFGGVISKLVDQGAKVKVFVMFDTQTARSELQQVHAKDAKDVLGYTFLSLLKLSPDVNDRVLIKHIETIIKSHDCHTLWSSGDTDLHQDHSKVFRAVCSAIRPSKGLVVPRFITGEIISSTDQTVGSVRSQFISNYYVPLDDTHIQRKIDAMKCYPGEYSRLRDSEYIRAYAIKRGGEIAHPYAEAFMLQRTIVS